MDRIEGYQKLIRAAVHGAFNKEAQEFYFTAMAEIYGRVKRRSGYELVPQGTDSILIYQHGELLGGYYFKEETQAMQVILVELDPNNPNESVPIFIDKAVEALLELIKKNV